MPKFRRRKEQKKGGGPLRRAFRRAEDLLQAGKYAEALEFLEGYRGRHPGDALLHHYLALAATGVGDTEQALADMERAVELGPRLSPSLLFPLALVYEEAGLHAHAMRTLRRLVEEHPRDPMVAAAREILADLVAQARASADRLGVSIETLEEATYWLDRCRRAIDEDRWADAEQNAVQASQVMPEWTPPRNNRALALYFMGQPQAAVQATREVLDIDPQNVHALGNLVRFLVALDDREAAREALERLRAPAPEALEHAERPFCKIAEAFAFLDADQEVYDALHQAQQAGEPMWDSDLYVLGVAAANLGKDGEAVRHWNEILRRNPSFFAIEEYRDLVRQGRPGPGLATRYPYFAPTNLVPPTVLDEFIQWTGQLDEMDEEQVRQEGAEWARRYPALHALGLRLIWEENQAMAGILVLRALGTPRAARELRCFAEGQVGADEDRMLAAQALVETEVHDPDTPVRLWQNGAWREVLVRRFVVTDEPDVWYEPRIAEMLNEAMALGQEGKLDEAKKTYERLLKREPNVKEAWGNLGAMAIQAGDREAGEGYLRRALEVDPQYVFAVCNLAMLCISDGNMDEAHDLLQPLTTRTRFMRQEALFFFRVQARLATLEREYEVARNSLQYILELNPDDESARNQLLYLGLLSLSDDSMGWAAEYQARTRRRRFQRRDKTILTPDSTLAEGLAPFTKDILVGMTRALGIRGVSGKRKAEVFDAVVGWVSEPNFASWIWPDLTDAERAALGYVLEAGGWVLWDDFSQRHGDDGEESPYWNYHEPETLMGRLRVRGLLIEGVVDEEVVVMVPRELRESLARLLAE